MTSRWILAVMAFAVLGCATHPAVTARDGIDAAGLTYDKPGVPAAQRELDEGECAQAAVADPGTRIGVALPYSFDRDAFAACMRDRGYVVRDVS